MIKLINISKNFGNNSALTIALNNINCNINQGDFITISGKSGSGKTTFLNIIGGITQPTSGKYLFLEKNITEYTMKDLSHFRKENIGFILQHFGLIDDMNIFENIALPLKYRNYSKQEIKERVNSVLESLEITNKSKNFPSELSGGEKQRVAIARAIVAKPKILLADEPTGALDEKTGQKILDIFNNLNSAGKTIILVTHDKEIASLGTRHIVMKDGEIVSS